MILVLSSRVNLKSTHKANFRKQEGAMSVRMISARGHDRILIAVICASGSALCFIEVGKEGSYLLFRPAPC
jgi:hypothetical protein